MTETTATPTPASTNGPTAGAGTPPSAATDTRQLVPVSATRVRDCLLSARFWVGELPRYADREQRMADYLALGSAVLGAITGLSIWPLLETGTDIGKAVFSTGAFLTALLAAIPRVFNFGEMAGQARELASRYGNVVGDLVDLDALNGNFNQAAALAAVTEFESTKQKKDALRRLPDKEKVIARRRRT